MDSETKKHQLDFHRQLTQTSTDYALKALNSLFLLNGSAATAILAAKNTNLYNAGFFFALGAISAVISLFMAYFCNSFFAEAWNPVLGHPERSQAEKRAFIFLKVASGFAITGTTLFLIGVILGAPELLSHTLQETK